MSYTLITVCISYPPDGEEFAFKLPASGVSVVASIESAFGIKLAMPLVFSKITYEQKYYHGTVLINDAPHNDLYRLPFLQILHGPEIICFDIPKAEEDFKKFLLKPDVHGVIISLEECSMLNYSRLQPSHTQ